MVEYNSVSDYEVLVERATELRKNPTYAEKILWSKLKNGLSGYDFLFQVVMVPFIPDFVCLSAKLIIELDGEVHDFQRNYDEDRDINLAVSGYKILRFSNNALFSCARHLGLNCMSWLLQNQKRAKRSTQTVTIVLSLMGEKHTDITDFECGNDFCAVILLLLQESSFSSS